MNISRRDFLRGAAASTMGLAVSSILPVSAMAEEAAPVSTAPAWLGEEPVIDESQIAETWDTDFLIVGAGNGGMMAASVAADYGIDFRVIEQNSVVCDTRHWYGAINTAAAKEAGVTVDVAKLRSEASRYTSGKMDQRVLNVWINESAAMHDYLAPILEEAGLVCDFCTDQEVEVENHTQYYCPPQQHFWGDFNPPRNNLLQERIAKKGYYIDFNTSLVKLEKADGKVTGVIAQNVDTGAYIRINAAWGVLLATGGYEGNPDMIDALCPIVPKCVTACSFNPSNKGMGIKAGIWAGAEHDLEPAPMIFDRGLVAPGVNAGYVDDGNGNRVFP
ncbi:MAG: FAD-binding protein, partial [Eubacteriales bacterium]